MFSQVLVTRSFPQLAAQSEAKWTSKKKKRLEKYIVGSKIYYADLCVNYSLSVDRIKNSRKRSEL